MSRNCKLMKTFIFIYFFFLSNRKGLEAANYGVITSWKTCCSNKQIVLIVILDEFSILFVENSISFLQTTTAANMTVSMFLCTI